MATETSPHRHHRSRSQKAAKFFEDAFGMTRAGTARRGIYMSDGTMNVALLKTEVTRRPASTISACGSTISMRRRRRSRKPAAAT